MNLKLLLNLQLTAWFFFVFVNHSVIKNDQMAFLIACDYTTITHMYTMWIYFKMRMMMTYDDDDEGDHDDETFT